MRAEEAQIRQQSEEQGEKDDYTAWRTFMFLAQSLAPLVGSLGEAGFDLPSLLASGLWPHLFSTLRPLSSSTGFRISSYWEQISKHTIIKNGT